MTEQNAYLAQIVHQRDQARAELAQLHEGEEPHLDEHTVATPAQWIWHWNRATPDRRLEVITEIQGMQDRADRCFMGFHEGQIADLRQRLADEHRTSAGLAAELHKVRQLLRKAEDELAVHRQQRRTEGRLRLAWHSARRRAARFHNVLEAHRLEDIQAAERGDHRLRDDLTVAQARIAAVHALHHDDYGLCYACTNSHGVLWPCPTIAALDGQSEHMAGARTAIKKASLAVSVSAEDIADREAWQQTDDQRTRARVSAILDDAARSQAEPELTVRMMTPPLPACPDCKMPRHGGYTCDEATALGIILRKAFDEACSRMKAPHLGAAFTAAPTRDAEAAP